MSDLDPGADGGGDDGDGAQASPGDGPGDKGILGWLADKLDTKQGQSRAHPCPTCKLTEDKTYGELKGPLFGPKGPQPGDVKQGGLGDCYFLSSLMSTAAKRPDLIQDAIKANPDGTYTVTFQNPDHIVVDADGNRTLQLGSTVSTTVDRDVPMVNGVPKYAQQNGPIWPEIMEKAYAQEYGGSAGYAAIGTGGYGTETIPRLTGYYTTNTGNIPSFDSLKDQNATGAIMTADSNPKNVPDANMVKNHAYSVQNVYTDANGNQKVDLINPWNQNAPEKGAFTMSYSDFQKNFRDMNIASPPPIPWAVPF